MIMKHNIPRNPYAILSKTRNGGGPMKHKLEGKSGAHNDQPELLEQNQYDSSESDKIDECTGVIPGTFIACGEGEQYCSDFCWSKANHVDGEKK